MAFSLASSSSFESESLTVEKIDAMKRFERRRKLWKLLPVVEAFVAVLALYSWLMPSVSAVEIAGDYLRRLSGGLNRGVFVFAVVNVLVAVILYLSNLQKQIETDLYGQYVSSAAAISRSAASAEAYTLEGKQETDANINVHSVTPEKTEVCSVGERTNGTMKSNGAALTAGREMVRAVSSVVGRREMTLSPSAVKSDVSLNQDEASGAVKSDGGALTARREMVRAVSSVDGRREMTVLPFPLDAQVYRRSTSVRIDRRRISRRWCEIDDLSSEEFRTTVETFIAGKKMMLLRETFHV